MDWLSRLIGLAVSIALGILFIKWRRSRGDRDEGTFGLLVLGALIVGGGFLLYHRARDRQAVTISHDAEQAFAAKDCKRAVELLGKLIEREPDEPAHYENRSSCLSDLGQHQAAVADDEKAMQLMQQRTGSAEPPAAFFYNRGVTLTQLGNLRAAIRAFEHALKLDPSYPDAANNLAWILATANDATLRDPQRAVRLAEDECRRSKFERPEHVGTLAAAHAAAGDFEQAVSTQRKVLELTQGEDRLRARARLTLFEEKQTVRDP
jgi:tetratricopeptide (TPR) repeat protein